MNTEQSFEEEEMFICICSGSITVYVAVVFNFYFYFRLCNLVNISFNSSVILLILTKLFYACLICRIILIYIDTERLLIESFSYKKFGNLPNMEQRMFCF